MKKSLIYLLSAMLIGGMFTACEQSFPDQPVTPPTTGYTQEPIEDANFVVTLTTGVNPLVITEETVPTALALFTCSSLPALAEGDNTELKFQAQISENEDFSGAKIIDVPLFDATTKEAFVSLQDVNDSLQAFAKNGDQRTIYTRLVVYLVDNGKPLAKASQTLTLLVTPYFVPVKEPIFITGNMLAVAEGWKNDVANLGTNLLLLFTADNDGANQKFTITTSMNNDGEAKFPTAAGLWDPCWGYEDGKLILKNNSGNYKNIGATGFYTLTIDLKTLELTMTSYDASAAATYEKIGLIGDATPGGWSADTDLTQVAPHVWAALVELSVGEIKFRSDADWANNWGIPDNQSMPFGVAGFNVNAPNFKITTAGKYYIALNDLTGHYIVMPYADVPLAP